MIKTITVPDSWNEVPVGKFQEIIQLDPTAKDYGINIVSIMLDEETENVRRFDINSFNAIMRHLEWLTKMPREDYYKTEIVVDGITYNMIENLNGFSGGEFLDMEHYLENQWENLHLLLAMFYRPAGEEYTINGLKKRAAIFAEKVMIGEVYGALLFFSTVGKESLLTVQEYLIQKMKQSMEKSQHKKTWLTRLRQRNGVGTAFTTG